MTSRQSSREKSVAEFGAIRLRWRDEQSQIQEVNARAPAGESNEILNSSALDFMEDKSGASEGIRTLDIHLGKVTLYQAELRSRPCLKRCEN